MIKIRSGPSHPSVNEAVLFPFDSHSIPFTAGLRLHMESGKGRTGSQTPVVLKRGERGKPDDEAVRFYGTVIPGDHELRIWYMARSLDDPRSSAHRICYAVSKDGYQWEKPSLGLVEYMGSRENNIVDFNGGACEIETCPMIYDPEDPDPGRRYKMVFECARHKRYIAVAFSPDGLRWTEPPGNPKSFNMEQTGLIHYNGCYFVNGHGGYHFAVVRNLVTYASYDFEHWTQAACLGFQKDRVPSHEPFAHARGATGEQVHLGAGLWNRGNVILGVTDLWHGHPSGERKLVTMDLGLLISHDALHYEEALPDFRLVPGYEEAGSRMNLARESENTKPLTRGPVVSHGQGMCNWGEQTMLFYEVWYDGDIRLAVWPRDRLGFFKVFDPEEFGIRARPEIKPHCMSCMIEPGEPGGRLYANVDFVSEHAECTIELLDGIFRPIPGFSGEACIPLREGGLRQPVSWKGKDLKLPSTDPFHIRVNFEGVRPEDVRLYALYVILE